MIVKYKKLNDDAIMPTRGSEYAAGYDLYSNTSGNIYPGDTVLFGTGISMVLPEHTFGGIYARSGLATKRGLRPANCVGVIDSDYRGEIIVAIHNDSSRVQRIDYGDRIAQLIIQPYIVAEFEEVTELPDTDRGAGGFGSTGEN